MTEPSVSRAASPRVWNGRSCPYCGAEESAISYDTLGSVEAGQIAQRATCARCDRVWHETYQLQYAEGEPTDDEREDPSQGVRIAATPPIPYDESLLAAALEVLGSWEHGDLAAAVRGVQGAVERLIGPIGKDEGG